MQDYQFRMSTDTIVDATKRGSVARFINHSCDANCSSEIVTDEVLGGVGGVGGGGAVGWPRWHSHV